MLTVDSCIMHVSTTTPHQICQNQSTGNIWASGEVYPLVTIVINYCSTICICLHTAGYLGVYWFKGPVRAPGL